MYPTRKQISRLIRNADRVSINDIFYSVMSYNLQRGHVGSAIVLVGDRSRREHSLKILLECQIAADGQTLITGEGDRLVFYKLKILNINGTS